jgi:hypothetical protein
MAKPKSPQLALVVWNDAHADLDQAWIQADGYSHAPLRVTTVGWIVKDDQEGVTLFSESIADTESASFRARSFIPRGMIVDISPLASKKPRKKVLRESPPLAPSPAGAGGSSAA